MTEEERRTLIIGAIWWWLPARWEHDGATYEVKHVELTGDTEDGGVDLSVTKDDGDETVVSFTNGECYGETPMDPASAKSRIYSEVV